MKHKLLSIVSVIALLGIGAASIQLFSHRTSADKTCVNVTGESHEVMIMNGSVSPVATTARVCDTFKITNHDSKAREIAFGAKDHHISYDGVSEKVLNRGQSLSITLTEPGDFQFHDHLQEDVGGTLTVR